jgi:peptidyl-prolyl cis-trans isomerase SurA
MAAMVTLLALLPARAEVVDRIVATVNGHIILQSDWDEALCYEALLNGRALGQFTEDERRAVLDRLIDQELLAEQMKSALFQHASEAEAATRIADARKHYQEASNEAGWQAVLGRFRLTGKDVLAHVRQQIDLMRLVDAHLRPAVQIDNKTIEAYYREKFVPQLKQNGAGEVALAEVSGKIRELLTEEKVSELLVSWLQSLRSESKVSIPGVASSVADGEQTR